MAYVNPVYGHEIFIEVAPTATSTTFTTTGLINSSRGVSFATSVEEDDLVDLDDQSKPAQKNRRISGTDFTVDGSGLVHKADLADFVKWSLDGEVRNVKVHIGDITITGPMVLGTFTITGDRMKTVENSIALMQAGPMTVEGLDD